MSPINSSSVVIAAGQACTESIFVFPTFTMKTYTDRTAHTTVKTVPTTVTYVLPTCTRRRKSEKLTCEIISAHGYVTRASTAKSIPYRPRRRDPLATAKEVKKEHPHGPNYHRLSQPSRLDGAQFPRRRSRFHGQQHSQGQWQPVPYQMAGAHNQTVGDNRPHRRAGHSSQHRTGDNSSNQHQAQHQAGNATSKPRKKQRRRPPPA
jgi:hypothetical protein